MFYINIFAQWPGSVSNNVKTEKFKGFICCGFKASFVITTEWHWTKWNIIFLWIKCQKTFPVSLLSLIDLASRYIYILNKNESCIKGIWQKCLHHKRKAESLLWSLDWNNSFTSKYFEHKIFLWGPESTFLYRKLSWILRKDFALSHDDASFLRWDLESVILNSLEFWMWTIHHMQWYKTDTRQLTQKNHC